MLSIGIDFGTSNSSVAAFDAATGALRLLPLDRHARDPRVMRSLLYITRDGDIVAGQRALDLYTEQNTGREVRLERRYIGEVRMVFGEDVGEVVKDAFALIDVNEPGRLFQSLKRFLSVTSFRKTNVFGREYTLEELVATLARALVRAAEDALGERVRELVVGRPVRFAEDAERDGAARRRLEEAWALAGVERVRFVEEPVGAARHYAAEAQLAPGTRFLVFDFGGGTLDITVARAQGRAIDVLATGGVPVGGDLLDSRIMETRVAHHFGRGARYQNAPSTGSGQGPSTGSGQGPSTGSGQGPSTGSGQGPSAGSGQGLPVPSHLLSKLRSWQTIVELNRPDLLELIREAARSTDRPQQFAALETLVTRNYGLALFRAIEEAKIALSAAEGAVVRLDKPGIRVEQPLARHDFEAAIAAQIRSARACAVDAVARAGCDPEEIALVITTGGSSLIPAFRRALREALPRAALSEAETFTSVAAGLALAGA